MNNNFLTVVLTVVLTAYLCSLFFDDSPKKTETRKIAFELFVYSEPYPNVTYERISGKKYAAFFVSVYHGNQKIDSLQHVRVFIPQEYLVRQNPIQASFIAMLLEQDKSRQIGGHTFIKWVQGRRILGNGS